jgi:5'-nucleotidase / UDP-sugar diphosphatase
MDCDSHLASTRFSYRFRLKFLLLGFLLLLFAPLSAWVRAEKDLCGDSHGDPRCRQPFGNDCSDIQKITFVHVSDVHARYNPDKNGSSPAGRIRGYYQQVKKENPFTLFTNAGDDYEKGSIAEELSRGQSTREVVEAMQYDVRTLGNHDFAWGIEELLRFSHDPSAIVLATNTTMRPGSEQSSRSAAPGWTDFAIRTVGCVKIGFFGLLSKPWNEKDQQYEGLFYPEIPELKTDFHFIDRAKDIIARHRQEVDVLVLVSHLGLPDDIALAEKTTGIDQIGRASCRERVCAYV